jgi:hypothetical protein
MLRGLSAELHAQCLENGIGRDQAQSVRAENPQSPAAGAAKRLQLTKVMPDAPYVLALAEGGDSRCLAPVSLVV